MEFYRPEYWSGYPFPSPGDLPDSAIEPRSPALQADFLTAEPQGKPFINVHISYKRVTLTQFSKFFLYMLFLKK